MGKIIKVSGPLVVAEGLADAGMADVVKVGAQGLKGEILTMTGDQASIQVYEETAGLGPGAEVVTTGAPLSVELGPGLLESIYDGIQRPLTEIRALAGETIARGIDVPALNRTKKWHFVPVVEEGCHVSGGDIIGTVEETSAITHRIMVPHGVEGELISIKEGDFTVLETVAVVTMRGGSRKELTMMQTWPVRRNRPYKRKFLPDTPMQSGQRVIDTLFPIAKGGTAAVPGPFGSGKTVVQHALAKWSDVDIVVYIGCGERGNEMTDVLMEFPELQDPRTGEPLMKRTVLIANTSDMPVAAREASIYTGITIPAYLASRLAQFYERAGCVECLASEPRRGSLTAIGAVSPPGGDTSEPVSQATLRIVKVFWGLDSSLAHARHFPAINWLNSYSLYMDNLRPWYDRNLGRSFLENRAKAVAILQEENNLQEIVKLVGQDALSAGDRLTMETAKMIREDFLQQNAFVDIDNYSTYERQAMLLDIILRYDDLCRKAVSAGADLNKLIQIEARDRIGRAKSVPAETYAEEYSRMADDMAAQIKEASHD